MTDPDDTKSEQAKRAEEFFAAEQEMLEWEEKQAAKAKEDKRELEREPGETTGEWLARRDVLEEEQRRSK